MARPRSPYPPQTPAQRQEKCRAIKRGTWHVIQPLELQGPAALPLLGTSGPPPALPDLGPPTAQTTLPPLEGPATSPAKSPRELPAPPVTAIEKAVSPDAGLLALANADGPFGGAADGPGDALRLSLPPAVAARLRSLLGRRDAGKSLTASERAEADGLLDIAEYFVVQRLRRCLAA